jgi:AraC-like DNA-binding protein
LLFEFNLYSSILLLFFIVGLVFAVLLFAKSALKKTKADKWLGLFLILCILYIAPWMLGFAGWYDNPFYKQIILYITFHHLLFIGPVIYFYVQSLLNPSFVLNKKNWIHFIPGMLYLLYALFTWLADCYFLSTTYFYADGMDREFDGWYQNIGFVSMLAYFIASLQYYNLYKKIIVQNISYADWVLFRWIKTFLIAFLIILIVKVLFHIAGYFPFFQQLRYKGSWGQFFLFGIVYSYVAIMGFFNEINTKLPFETKIANNNITLEIENAPIGTETNELESDANLQEWKLKLEKYLVSDKSYQNEELNLTQVAKALQTNQNIISKTINQGFGVNFNDWVNIARVNAVKLALQNGEQKSKTLLSIAFDCGFNSKATFNRAFKKHTNLSPKEWMEQKIS